MGLCFFTKAHKILFETSFAAGLGFNALELFVALFDWRDEIVDILPDKDLEDQISSLFEEVVRHLEDRDIELNGAVLIHSGLTSGRMRDVGRDEINLCYLELVEEIDDRFAIEDVPLEKRHILMSHRCDLLDIDSDNPSGRTDCLGYNLEPAPWRARDIKYLHPRMKDLKFLIDLEEFESTSGAVSEALGFKKILVLNDILGLSF